MDESSYRRSRRGVWAIALVAAVAATLSACSGVEGVADERVYQTADGVLVVDTYAVVATVTAVDAAKRTVKLTDANGKSSTLKASKDVDLGAFTVGETIGVQVSEETALSVRRDGTPADAAAEVDLAAGRGERGTVAFTSAAVEVSGVVLAIDAPHRKVTFRLADGSQKIVKAHKGVDLSGLAVGDTVIVGYAEQVVIAAGKP
jgi:hypothetical protein